MPGTTYERPRVLRLRFRGARRLHTVSHADERLPRSRRATASRASTGRRRGRACDLGRHVRGVLRRCFSSRAAVELPREPLAWTRGFSDQSTGGATLANSSESYVSPEELYESYRAAPELKQKHSAPRRRPSRPHARPRRRPADARLAAARRRREKRSSACLTVWSLPRHELAT